MGDAQTSETTQLLRAWARGDQSALEMLTPRVYSELLKLAGHCMRHERPGKTMQTTELVHEAYLRLVNVKNVDWRHRAHFYAVCAAMMRHILLDRARRRIAVKRGGVTPRLNVDLVPDVGNERDRELIALDDALDQLAALDARKARVVELRFFGGLNAEETASVLGISSDTVLRDWKLARVWLLTEMSGGSVAS